MSRPDYLGVNDFYNLDTLCRTLADAFDFGYGVFLVGSALKRPDYRDVDLRCILPDEEYDRMFPGAGRNPYHDPFWRLLCVSISEWMRNRTGLPIDFQVQRATEANEEFPMPEHQRNAVGCFVSRPWSNEP